MSSLDTDTLTNDLHRVRRDLSDLTREVENSSRTLLALTKALDNVSRDLTERVKNVEEGLTWHEREPHVSDIP